MRPGEKNQQEMVPLSHYRGIYKTLDPGTIARRCALPFYPGVSAFGLRIMGTEYLAAFPDFELRDNSGAVVKNAAENILLLRYLCEGKYFPFGGKQLSYHEIPWGPVYYSNFRGRCINRFAACFGGDLAAFRRIMEKTGELRAEPLGQGDAGYRFEVISGLFMGLILWAGDEEFPPSAQILFDDNFVFAFTAEDLAVLGEMVLDRLKGLLGPPVLPFKAI
ncbi:MAG: DUF3786 domain-containing protein [Spirochaetaceae bacterium]|nr:DUF3786 domain-containing protein [Spirochaetaceae bacterium]